MKKIYSSPKMTLDLIVGEEGFAIGSATLTFDGNESDYAAPFIQDTYQPEFATALESEIF